MTVITSKGLRLCRRALQLAMVLAALALSGFAVSADAPAWFDHAGLAETQLTRHIRPGYARLAASSAHFAAVVDRFCAVGVEGDRKPLETAYDRLVDVWGRIEHITFGPIAEGNRHERMFFWPDRRGLGARQIAAAVASRDPTVLEPTSLASKSVALQGLGAIEQVLFGEWPDAVEADARSYRCGFARSIAANMAATAQAVSAEWARTDGYARLWQAPGPANSTFAGGAEITSTLGKAMDRGLDRARNQRLIGPLGFTKQRRKTSAPLNISGRSLRLVSANVYGILDLYSTGGLEGALVRAANAGKLFVVLPRIRRLAGDLRFTRDRLAGLRALRRPFADGSDTSGIISVGFPLKSARAEAATLLTLVAGVPADFTVTDGD